MVLVEFRYDITDGFRWFWMVFFNWRKDEFFFFASMDEFRCFFFMVCNETDQFSRTIPSSYLT